MHSYVKRVAVEYLQHCWLAKQ